MSSRPFVFINYAKEDSKIVFQINKFLRENGCETWIDVERLQPGQDWNLEIEKALAKANFFVACLSTTSVAKIGFVQAERKDALEILKKYPEDRVFVIPIRLDDCPVPSSLSKYQYLNWFERKSRRKLLLSILPNSSENTVVPPQLSQKRKPDAETNDSQHWKQPFVEFVFLLNWIVDHVTSLQFVGYTFGESRRILAVILRLFPDVHGRFYKIKNVLNSTTAEELSDYLDLKVWNFISWSETVLPGPSEDQMTRYTDEYKTQKYYLKEERDNWLSRLLSDNDLQARFETLRVSESRWVLLGFKDREEYNEYVSPTFASLKNSPSVMVRHLLNTLVESPMIRTSDLIALGFPKDIIVESINSLLRSELIQRENDELRVTVVGKKIIQEALNQD